MYVSLSNLKFNQIEEMHENKIMISMTGCGLPNESQQNIYLMGYQVKQRENRFDGSESLS